MMTNMCHSERGSAIIANVSVLCKPTLNKVSCILYLSCSAKQRYHVVKYGDGVTLTILISCHVCIPKVVLHFR